MLHMHRISFDKNFLQRMSVGVADGRMGERPSAQKSGEQLLTNSPGTCGKLSAALQLDKWVTRT